MKNKIKYSIDKADVNIIFVNPKLVFEQTEMIEREFPGFHNKLKKDFNLMNNSYQKYGTHDIIWMNGKPIVVCYTDDMDGLNPGNNLLRIISLLKLDKFFRPEYSFYLINEFINKWPSNRKLITNDN